MKKENLKLNMIALLMVLVGNFYGVQAQQISLAGSWRFKTDPTDAGVNESWFNKKLEDHILLPGSMLTNNKGDGVTLHTKWTGSIYDSSWFFIPRFAKYRQPGNIKFPFWLTPAKYYTGAAWYQKEVIIPASWKGKHISLFLERCHTETTVWIDGKAMGMQNSMVTPHQYDLGNYLFAGKHIITIKIDNRIKTINVGEDSHSLTDHTQGNWNGIIGRMELIASPPVYIADVQVYTDIKAKSVKVILNIEGNPSLVKTIVLSAKSIGAKTVHIVKGVKILPAAFHDKKSVEATIQMGGQMMLWDEFDPNLYQLSVQLNTVAGGSDEKSIQFGMRDFKTAGTHFIINGNTVFLRGTVDCCVFPLTGYPPTDVNSWLSIFRVAKEHGLNHIRFHSWCPPEAAFIAADKTGFYLQVEAPTWPNHGVTLGDNKPIDQFIYDETNRIAKAYGNYASFCMLASGNEPGGKNQAKYLAAFVQYWKAKDTRRVYTGASVGMSWPLVPENEYMVKSGPRNLNWTNAMPESKSDYRLAIEKFILPYVTHEMGQWCVFPDFTEIKKYTGAYRAKNFELFEEDLRDQGMGDQAEKFHLASGKLQVLCYKNEIEKTLRTKGLAGFQLLGLQDFPGQGTALIGTMNPFWENKRYITTKQFSSFCNSTVPLLRTDKFVYTNNETFNGSVEIYHYGKSSFKHASVYWRIKDAQGKLLQQTLFDTADIASGKNTWVGDISYGLSSFLKATALTVEVGIQNTNFLNSWNIWVYPKTLPVTGNEIYYTTVLDKNAEYILEKGGKVLLNIAGKLVKGKEVVQTFLPVFWNTSWFKMRPPHTLGILLDELHPAFREFPTGFYSDLQWWEIVNKSQVMHLEDFPKNFRPLVQPIDTWFLNRRLALVFEARVGNGKIIISSANFADTSGPAAKQLLFSLKKYMNSDQFNPPDKIDITLVKDLLLTPSKFVFDPYTKGNPDELKPMPAIINPK
ncbi:MAG: beta-glucuronidase [Ferruginibacter sp.]|nr:beta-glucuronidase [Ferruginibacter sp.]